MEEGMYDATDRVSFEEKDLISFKESLKNHLKETFRGSDSTSQVTWTSSFRATSYVDFWAGLQTGATAFVKVIMTMIVHFSRIRSRNHPENQWFPHQETFSSEGRSWSPLRGWREATVQVKVADQIKVLIQSDDGDDDDVHLAKIRWVYVVDRRSRVFSSGWVPGDDDLPTTGVMTGKQGGNGKRGKKKSEFVFHFIHNG